MFFWNGGCGFSAVGVGVILGNGCGVQGQNCVPSLLGSKAAVGFHCIN